jgi:hypothetical protein
MGIHATTYVEVSRRQAGQEDFCDFAVGISHKPLPNGTRFAIVTNTNDLGITATDAVVCNNSGVAGVAVKLPPTATNFCRTISITGKTAVGPLTITNGVKQQWFGVRFPGVELT